MKPVSKALPFEELKGVLNQLIPPRLRGAIKDPFRVTDLGGREGWTTYSYESVSIVFAFPVNIDPKDWKGPFTFPIENTPRKEQSKTALSSNSDFSLNDGIEVVMVTWTPGRVSQIDSQRRRLLRSMSTRFLMRIRLPTIPLLHELSRNTKRRQSIGKTKSNLI
jgi:hypothetical protein